jgi:hypothetical protein
LRFFSPPEKPSFTPRLRKASSISSELHLLRTSVEELDRVEFRLAAVLAAGVERGLQEVDVVHAGDLDRILEGEEDAGARALSGASASRSWPS